MESYFTGLVGDENPQYLQKKFLLNYLNTRKQESLQQILQNLREGKYKLYTDMATSIQVSTGTYFK